MYLPPSTDASFAPPPSGTHVAVCYRVIDLGTQVVDWQGQSKQQHKVMLSWELPDELMPDGEKAGEPFTIHQRYTLSSSEKATLRKHLEAWRGKKFTEEEIGKFKIESLIGVPCFLGIIHNEKDGKTYANIASISKLPKGMTAPAPKNKKQYLSLDPKEFDATLFASLSEGLRKVISESPEYAKLNSAPADDVPPPNGETDYGDMNDAIPF